MKKIFFSVILLFLAFSAAVAQFTKAELRADGLTCSLCSNATYKQLKTLDFVDSIGMDLEHATFLLYFKKDQNIDFDKIRNKVEFAGFSVGIIKATYNFNNFPVDTAHCFNLNGAVFCFINANTQTLNGETEIQIVDAGFISNKEYKKYAEYMAKHPEGAYMRVFHVIL